MSLWRILCAVGHHQHCEYVEGGIRCNDCGTVFSYAALQADYHVGAIVIRGVRRR